MRAVGLSRIEDIESTLVRCVVENNVGLVLVLVAEVAGSDPRRLVVNELRQYLGLGEGASYAEAERFLKWHGSEFELEKALGDALWGTDEQ